MTFIVAIDGPAGTGKSTITKSVAKKLNLLYVDTGAIYRLIALKTIKLKYTDATPAQLGELARHTKLDIQSKEGENHYFLDGEDVSQEIRTEAVSSMASVVSQHQPVRDALLDLQRRLGTGSEKGAILEGRDIGTVVFPGASLKFFLTATVKVRVDRRFKQLQSRGQNPDKDKLLQEIETRDERDSTREAAPLKKAIDAIEVDTSKLSEAQVIETVCAYIKEIWPASTKKELE